MPRTAQLKLDGMFEYSVKNHFRKQKSFRTTMSRIHRILHSASPSTPVRKLGSRGWWINVQNHILETEQIANGTINRTLSVCSKAMNFTLDCQLHETKCPKYPRLPEPESRMFYFPKEGVEKLKFYAVDIYNDQCLAEAIEFSAYTGLRQGELLKLKPEDIDWNLGCIWVGGKKHPTKANNVRQVDIHPKLEEMIRNRLSNEYLFGDDWLNKDHLYRCFVKVRRLAGFNEDYVWHCLRHSYGTWLGEVTHPRQIMALMGHKNIETTLKYCKITDKARKEAVLSI